MIRIRQSRKLQSDDGDEQASSVRLDTVLTDESESDPTVGKASDKRPEVLSAAYRILQSGANSRRMLREKLLKKGFLESEAQNAVETCEQQGLLHEKRLFLAYTESLATKKHYGIRRIRIELLKKFDRQSVDQFLDEAIEEIDFEALAKEEAEKCHKRGKRYTVSRLHTLGYSSHDIYEAISSFTWEEEPSDF